MPNFHGSKADLLDVHVDMRPLFPNVRAFEDNKEHVDLCRLSKVLSECRTGQRGLPWDRVYGVCLHGNAIFRKV